MDNDQKNLFISSFITDGVYDDCLGSDVRLLDRLDHPYLSYDLARKLGVVQTEACSWLSRCGVSVDSHNEGLFASYDKYQTESYTSTIYSQISAAEVV